MLTLREISHRYGDRRALDAVSAEMPAGHIVALVGRNGSGKTTLLRAIAALVSPASGSIEWRGIEPRALRPSMRARQFAYVAQHPSLAIDLTVREMVALGASQRQPAEGTRAVDGALAQIALESRAARSFHELSAGERQLCVVARALAQHEAGGLLVLDEPFSNLDPGETVRLAKVLRGVADRGGLVVVALHDLPLADQVADSVLLLEEGRVVGHGPPGDVLVPERLESVFKCPFLRGPQGLTLGR